MFYATVFRLVALNDGVLPHNTGRLAHAAFMDIVRSIDPALASSIHANQNRQPFTVSPIWSHQKELRAGDTAWLRITLLDQRLFETVAGYLLWKTGYPKLYIQALNFSVAEALTTSGSHPQAGAENLIDAQADSIPDKITLRFVTPTAITKGPHKTFWLTPEPVAIWHNLRRQWGNYGGADPGKEYDAWVEKSVHLIRQQTSTQTLKFDNRYSQAGFKGTATFRCQSEDLPQKMLWYQLARFSFYAGVGYKTTMGMGQVRLIDGAS